MHPRTNLLLLALLTLAAVIPPGFAQVQQTWAVRYSGTANPSYDHAWALALDGAGNVYVAGDAYFSDGTGGFATVKYNTNGAQLWVSRYNGGGVAEALAVDNSGNVYVAGQSAGDYTVVKYNTAGSQQWVARYNGPANLDDHPTALKVDAAGNVYVTGYSASAADRNDYATVKYSPSGTRLWAARYDGPANYDDSATALAVDNAGNAYVTGNSYSSDTGLDYATVKYGPNGNQLWVARYTSPGRYDDRAAAVGVDNAGNVYVTGRSSGDYVTVKYDANGVEQWVAHYSGPFYHSSSPSALAVDGSGNVVVTGAADRPGTGFDYATVKYDGAGHELWVARYNGAGSDSDSATALTLDSAGNTYVTGWSGPGDYATVKYDPKGNQIWVARYNGPGNGYDEARAVAVDGAGSVFVTGYSAGAGAFDYATVKYSQPVIAGLPTITTPPQSQTVVAGSAVMFSVAADGSAPLTFQWRFDGTNIPGATSTTLVLAHAQSEDEGDYSVRVSNAAGATATPEARLTVQVPPTISTQPSSQSVYAGESAEFYVEAAGRPAPTYQWQRNGVNLADSTNVTLTVSNLTGALAGNYTVIVSNPAGTTTSAAAVLTVEEVAPSVAFQSQSQTVPEGEAMFLYVSANGHPPPTYRWRFNGLDLPGATNSNFSVPNVAPSQGGSYTVVLSNYVGVVTSAVILVTVVQTPPGFPAQPLSQSAFVGASATFSVVASGNPPPGLRWWFNGQPLTGATNRSLTLSNLSPASAGGYFVVASNAAGAATSAIATLTVPYPGPLDHWQQRFSPAQGQGWLNAVTFANGLFVAVGDFGATSSNGVDWIESQSGPGFYGLAWGNNLFVAVGGVGRISTSTDGVQWTPHNLASAYDFSSVAYGNGLFVAVGGYYDSTIFTSTNGVDWTKRDAASQLTLRGVAYGNGRFLAAGYSRNSTDNLTLSSTNGINWTSGGYSNPNTEIYGVCFGAERFVCAGSVYFDWLAHSEAEILTVTRTNAWQWLYGNPWLYAAAYGGGNFVAVGWDGVIVSSPDGYRWTRRYSGTSQMLRGVAYGLGTFVAVDDRGRIYQSGYTPVTLAGRWRPGAGFEVTATGGVDGFHTLRAKDGLDTNFWNYLTFYSANYATNAQFIFRYTDTDATNFSRRFYSVSP